MPYCPKCDMEFVDGITTCSDCGGPLVASKEEADRLKREEQLKRQKEQQNLTQEMLSMEMNGADADSFSGYASEDFHNLANSDDPDVSTKGSRSTDPASALSFKQQSTAYVDKGQKYEDLRSSCLRFSHRRRRSPDLLGSVLVTDRPSAYGWIFPLSDPGCSDRHGNLLYGSLHKIKQICQGSASAD